VIGDKRARCCTAVNGLQDGGFHLQEAAFIEELAQRCNHGSPGAEDFPYFRVDSQVGIPLAVAGFGIGEGGMPHHFPIDHFILGSR